MSEIHNKKSNNIFFLKNDTIDKYMWLNFFLFEKVAQLRMAHVLCLQRQCQNTIQYIHSGYHKIFTAMWWMPMQPNGKMVRKIWALIFYDNTPPFGIQFEKKT